MTINDALVIIEKQRDDYKATSDNFERVFPGATSAYHELVEAYTIAVAALQRAEREFGDYFPLG